jgi:hypothetical protein
VLALLARAREIGARITLPATAFAQAIRHPAKQVRLSRLARQPTTELVAFAHVFNDTGTRMKTTIEQS